MANRHIPANPSLVRERRRTRTSMNRYQAIEILGGCCVDCGYKENLNGLEFDHVVPGEHNIASLIGSYRWERALEELKKCELVCGTCHNIRTAARGRLWRTQEQEAS